MELIPFLLALAVNTVLSPCERLSEPPSYTCNAMWKNHTVCAAEVKGYASRVWWEKKRPWILQTDVRTSDGWHPARVATAEADGALNHGLPEVESCAIQDMSFSSFYQQL